MFLWSGVPGYLAIVLRTFVSMITTLDNSSSHARVPDHQLVPGQWPTHVVMLCFIYIYIYISPSSLRVSGLPQSTENTPSPHMEQDAQGGAK